jgi:2-dehydro-3-deoxyphosphogluconate aldolase/(4S)-4-hydroxy-2-oxoglutarate aldolase
VLRCDSADVALRVADILIEAGLRAIEITMTVPNAIDAITALARRAGSSSSRPVIGAGTVIDADAARRAIDAGAQFIVSPGLVPEVIQVARGEDAGVAVLPGALTPTEILAAARAGGDLIKVFPVQQVGGPAYIRALRGPFPDIPLVPTGGVDLDNVADHFRAGATAVGVGSELVSRDALARKDWAGITVRAEQFLAAVAAARGQLTRAERARV